MRIKKGKLFLIAVASVALAAAIFNDKKNKCTCNEDEFEDEDVNYECENCFELKN